MNTEDLTTEEKVSYAKRTISEIISYFSLKIIFSFWLIFSLNTFFHTGYPYDFAHILAAWFFMTFILRLVSKK